MRMIKNNNRGFTLIEILLVVGFIALASVGVYTIYAKVSAGNQANAESRNLDTFKAGIQTLYAVGKNYASITNIVVNAARITPDNMKTSPTSSDGTITNSFSGEVTVLPVSLGAGTANGFEITYSKVPGNVCSKLVTTGGNQYDRITVGGTEVKAFGTNKFQEDAAAIACNGAPSEGITIKFASL